VFEPANPILLAVASTFRLSSWGIALARFVPYRRFAENPVNKKFSGEKHLHLSLEKVRVKKRSWFASTRTETSD
jgi:hypothetical protein